MVCMFCAWSAIALFAARYAAAGARSVCAVLAFVLAAAQLLAGETNDPPNGYWFDNLEKLTTEEYSFLYAGLGGAGTSYDNGEVFAVQQNPSHVGMSGLRGGRVDFALLSPQTWRNDDELPKRSGSGGRVTFGGALAGVNLGFGLVYSELDTDTKDPLPDFEWNGMSVPNLTSETVRSLSAGFAAEYYLRAAVGISARTVSTLQPAFAQQPAFAPARGTLYDVGFTAVLDSRDLQRRLIGSEWGILGIRPQLELGAGAVWANQGRVMVPAMGIAVFTPRNFSVGAHAGIAFSADLGATEVELFRAVISAAALDDRRETDWLDVSLCYRDAGARLQFLNDVVMGELHPGIEQRRGAMFEVFETFTFGSGLVRPRLATESFWTNNRQHAWGLRADGMFKLGAALWENPVTQFCAGHLTVSWSTSTIGELRFFRGALDIEREHQGFSIGLKNLTL